MIAKILGLLFGSIEANWKNTEKAEKRAQEFDEIAAAQKSESLTGDGWGWPSTHRPPRVTLHFGWQTLNGKPYNHTGTDFAHDPSGCFAVADGVVQKVLMPNPKKPAQFAWKNGEWVRVSTADESPTPYVKMICDQTWVNYKHVKALPGIKPGVKVKKGQKIGYDGQYGYCFGPHLHLEVYPYSEKKKKSPWGLSNWPKATNPFKFLTRRIK